MKPEDLANHYISFYKAAQNKGELVELIKILRKEKIKRVLEIGVDSGGTLKLWRELVGPRGTVIGVDVNENKIDEAVYIRGNSHDIEIVKKVKKELKGKKVDFLFIDGDHSYYGVKMDFDYFKRFVKKGGLIGFHDIKQKGIGVPKFWNEIKKNFKSMEFYMEEDILGIGLLRNEYLKRGKTKK